MLVASSSSKAHAYTNTLKATIQKHARVKYLTTTRQQQDNNNADTTAITKTKTQTLDTTAIQRKREKSVIQCYNGVLRSDVLSNQTLTLIISNSLKRRKGRASQGQYPEKR